MGKDVELDSIVSGNDDYLLSIQKKYLNLI